MCIPLVAQTARYLNPTQHERIIEQGFPDARRPMARQRATTGCSRCAPPLHRKPAGKDYLRADIRRTWGQGGERRVERGAEGRIAPLPTMKLEPRVGPLCGRARRLARAGRDCRPEEARDKRMAGREHPGRKLPAAACTGAPRGAWRRRRFQSARPEEGTAFVAAQAVMPRSAASRRGPCATRGQPSLPK